jgi:hypothetical protein
LFKRRLRLAKQGVASLRKRHAAGRSGEQPHAEPRLQPADRLADRRSGDAEPDGGCREAPFLGDSQEGVEFEDLARAYS